MKIISSDTAFPPHYYPQQEITSALSGYWSEFSNKAPLVERFHRNAGVDYRHLAMPLKDFTGLGNWGEANDKWIEIAVDIGEQAIRRALNNAGIKPEQIGALFFVSITGVANPSIDARLMNRIGFSSHLKRIPIFGLGCVAGAAGLARAADYVRAFPNQVALVLSVELCSLTWQAHDITPANIISTALFGDGAAAVVLAGRDVAVNGPNIIDTESVFYHDTENLMGWDISHDGLRVVLSPDVPKVCREHLGPDVDSFLARHGIRREDIGLWIMHTGGPQVLEAMADSLGLPAQALKHSWECLRKVGNLSSASVLVVLDDILKQHCPPAGTWGLLAAMGPGFCSELVLMRW
jgi:alkylresorcinol/alkylpyrone synthase